MSQSNTSRFLGLGRSDRKKMKDRITTKSLRRRRARVEQLEDRRVLALLGVQPGFPALFANSTGNVSYDSVNEDFVAVADPLIFQETAVAFPTFLQAPKSFSLNIKVDNTGTLIGGTAGHDLIIEGAVDIDFDNIPDATGTLLTGEITGFGFEDSGPGSTTDTYDFRFTVTGGALSVPGTLSTGGVRPAYFDGFDIGLRIDSENSSFAGDFTVDFAGGNKATLGPIEANQEINPAIEIIKYVDKIITTSEMTVIDFDDLTPGDVVGAQYPGVTVNAVNNRTGFQNAAMVFDSANPTGGDVDLGTPNQAFGGPGIGSGGATNDVALGNILIISEDQDASDPDDEAGGGVFTFTFDDPVTINHLDLLDIDNNEAGGSAVTVTTASGTQTFPIPTLGNNSYQRLPIGVDDVLELTVNFVSSGAITELKYTTTTEEKQWFDANTPEEAVEFEFGEDVEFSYHVTNIGDVPLTIDQIVDDNATPGSISDDFNPIPVESGGFNVGDLNQNGILDVNDGVNPVEEWIFTFTITPDAPGHYCNIATVTGTPVGGGPSVTDDDPGKYNVVAPPSIDIEKLTNGVQADDPSEAVEIAPGDTVTWTYIVTNTGGVAYAQADVVVVDDNGTPGDTSDDFSPTFIGPDAGNDGILSPGEVWQYEATAIADTLTTPGQSSTLFLDGNSSLDGPDGNIRTYTVDGVSVNASAFSRDSNGNWSEAFLGAFSGGLGVTDSSEGNGGNGTHRVDNVGRDNYVLFEFSNDVVVDSAFLDSVVGDSDLSIWIGTIPGAFGNHQTLSDALLNGLALNEVDNTTSSGSRFANFNAGGAAGNILVLAASTADTTPDDKFKIRKVKFKQQSPGIYGNVGSVDTGDASDSDPSHYVNPVPAPSAKLGDFVWNDTDRDGKQDAGEDGIAGVTVRLLDSAGNELATTVTAADGSYMFAGLDAGDYKLDFVAPADFVFSPKGAGSNDAIDSNANSDGLTDVISLAAHQINNSIDAGLYESAVDFMFEAEDYEWKDSPWKVYGSSSASGGKFIKAPNGTGSHYNSPPHGKKVMYQFNVDHAGNYEISGLVKAKNSKDNSVWIKVDNNPWVQWHMDVTGNSFQWQNVTDGWNKDATAFHLDAGSHTMQLKVREDGTKLDKFMFSKLAETTVVIDATAFESSDSAWQVEVDDDGNEFLIAAHGTHYSAPPAGSELTFSFNIDQAGQFQMHALVSALDGGSNSFWVAVDDGEWVQWHLSVTNGEWAWQTVTDGTSHQQVTFDLSEGEHTLRIKVREDGTQLDKIVITNDADIDLSLYE